jgi:Cu(I)/Ag(I) efflux system membrane fusion protein
MSTQLEYMNLLKWKEEKGHRFQRNVEFSWGDRFGTTGQMLTFDIEALLQVAKQRLKLWEIPDDVVKQMKNMGTTENTHDIHSSNGYIFQKTVFKGTRVSPGDKIFDVVDLSTVWVIADIYEYELPLVKVGQKAKITLSYFPEKEILSKVDFIYPALSGQTRTAKRFTVTILKHISNP